MKNWNKRQELKRQGYTQEEIYLALGGEYKHQNLANNNHRIPGPGPECRRKNDRRTK